MLNNRIHSDVFLYTDNNNTLMFCNYEFYNYSYCNSNCAIYLSVLQKHIYGCFMKLNFFVLKLIQIKDYNVFIQSADAQQMLNLQVISTANTASAINQLIHVFLSHQITSRQMMVNSLWEVYIHNKFTFFFFFGL